MTNFSSGHKSDTKCFTTVGEETIIPIFVISESIASTCSDLYVEFNRELYNIDIKYVSIPYFQFSTY